MNEQTAIELLKIANELMNFSAAKFGTAYLTNPPDKSSTNTPTPPEHTAVIFSECLKIVHSQYKELIKN